jgi:hypothetical protein
MRRGGTRHLVGAIADPAPVVGAGGVTGREESRRGHLSGTAAGIRHRGKDAAVVRARLAAGGIDCLLRDGWAGGLDAVGNDDIVGQGEAS